MEFHVEQDSAGRSIVHGTSERGRYQLNVTFIMYDHPTGRAFLTNDARNSLTPLSPIDVLLLTWFQKEHPRAEPQIFSGEPKNG